MFVTYIQNNTGGSTIGCRVIIVEADSLEEADFIAESHGVYFDGVEKDIDCDCCGNRWHRASEYDTAEMPSYYGAALDYTPDNNYNDFFMCDETGDRLILIIPKK